MTKKNYDQDRHHTQQNIDHQEPFKIRTYPLFDTPGRKQYVHRPSNIKSDYNK